MQSIVIEELDELLVIYLDGVLVYSKTREEQMKHLKTVLQSCGSLNCFSSYPGTKW